MDAKSQRPVACPVKILHRWTASPKPPSKLPVKDWCKDKKQRWFVANFSHVPSRSQLKYYHKRDDWTTGSKGTEICLAEVVSSRVLPSKDDEHRMEINLENYSVMVIFESRQTPEAVCKSLKTALRTFHVSVEKAPSRALMMSEYVASVEPDNISFRNVDTNEHCFQWEFSQVKGLQFKSEFGHLNIEVSKVSSTGGGPYVFSGHRVMQFAKKLKDFMCHEEDRYKPLPTHGKTGSNSLKRARTLSVPMNQMGNCSNGLYDVPHDSRGGIANNFQSGSDSGIFAPGPYYGHIPPQMMGQYVTNFAHLPQQPPHMQNMQYTNAAMMSHQAMYTNGHVPMYHGQQPRHQPVYPMGNPPPQNNGFEDENIYEEIPHDIIISRETQLDRRPPMALPTPPPTTLSTSKSSSPISPKLPLPNPPQMCPPTPSSPGRVRSSEPSPVPISSASDDDEEQEKMRQVEKAITQIAIGETTEAEDVGYIPVAPRVAKKEEPTQVQDGYLLMYPMKEEKKR